MVSDAATTHVTDNGSYSVPNLFAMLVSQHVRKEYVKRHVIRHF